MKGEGRTLWGYDAWPPATVTLLLEHRPAAASGRPEQGGCGAVLFLLGHCLLSREPSAPTHTFHVRKLTRCTICPGVPQKNGCSMTLLPQHCLTQSSLYNSLRMHIYIIRKTLALCAPIDLSYVNTNRVCVFNLSSQVILSYQTFGFTESSAVGSSG